MTIKRCGQRGSTLVTVLMVFMVFMILASTIVYLTYGRTFTLTGNIAQTKARYLAQSGVAAGLAALKQDKDKVNNTVTVNIDGQNITASITKPGAGSTEYTISSQAVGREGSRQFEATATAKVKLGFDWQNWPYALMVGGDFTGGDSTNFAKLEVRKGRVQVNGNWTYTGESRFEVAPLVAGTITENMGVEKHWKQRKPQKGSPVFIPDLLIENLPAPRNSSELNIADINFASGEIPVIYFNNTSPIKIYNGNPKSDKGVIIVAENDVEIYAPAKKKDDRRKKDDTRPVVIISLKGNVTIKETINFDGFIYAAKDVTIDRAIERDDEDKEDENKKKGRININGGVVARGNFNLNRGYVKIRLWEKGHPRWWREQDHEDDDNDEFDKYKSMLDMINSKLGQYMTSFQITDWQESYR